MHRFIRPGCLAGVAMLLLLLGLAPQALAVDPQTAVGGSGSKWFDGSLLQMDGDNCDIIGSSYTETMVSAIAGYGGAPNGQVVHVGDRYYASVLISIPGNPCGSGSSSVGTDVFLPRGVSVDTSAPIRCFGEPRGASTFSELTGGSWSFMGSSGPYCPAHVGASQSGAPGTIGVGFRPLANGQLYYLFVPIKSTQTLQGAGHNPADEIHWFISASATYVSPQATSVWVNVVDAGGGGTPFIYFARNPSVVPFWDTGAASGQENKAEWFANLYSAGYGGTMCFDLYDGDPPTGSPTNCSAATGWNGTVPAGGDSFQVFGSGASAGPNGGYVPFYYITPAFTYTIRWTFTYNPGGGDVTVTKDIPFTTLAGPDSDGDGVPDASDSCSTVKGTQSNGCPPPVQTDPDGDGVFGSADKCPAQNGGASLNGCPLVKDSDGDGVIDGIDKCPTVAAKTADGCPVLTGSLGAIKGNKLKRKALAKGVQLKIACSLDSKASATLTLKRAVAKKLKIKGKKKTVPIGSGSANCTAGKGKLKLKLKKSLAGKVRKPHGAVKATLTVVFKRSGSTDVTVKRAVKLT
jgi:hypothetical protein